MDLGRKDFLKKMGYLCAGSLAVPGMLHAATKGRSRDLFFDISLAQWSLHRTTRSGKITTLDFPVVARQEFDIDAIEYVNQLFFDKAKDRSYLQKLKNRCDNEGVKSLLIMVDREGALGDTNNKERLQAVENHHKWVEAADFLGCHSIRVNAAGRGTAEEVAGAAVDGLGRLSEFASKSNINVIVENHGGYSSNGKWLAGVIERVGMSNCGTLPDFGNFRISEGKNYNKYKGVKELMPYAKGVSAKSHAFDKNGYETTIDYPRMLKIVRDAGYRGYIGIEYEGDELSEYEGIRATKKLLKMAGEQVTKH